MKTRISMIAAAFTAAMIWSADASGQTSSSMQGGSSSSTHGSQLATTAIGSSGVGFYDMGEGGTATGSYLTGMAAFAQGFGQAAYNSSLAARNFEEAHRAAIDNQLHAEQTYFEMRRLNDDYWLSKHPPMTPEQQAQIDQSRLPRRLTSSELDPTWGTIRWPAVLERPEFDAVRTQLNDIFAHRGDESFGIGTPIYSQIQRLARDMRAQLDDDYPAMSQMEWIQAMRFVESLAYEGRFAPAVVVGMNVR
jgi:hypothetical protein